MFGMLRQKPSKEKAMKELRGNLALFGMFITCVRLTPYLLHYFQKEELQLDL